jgi:glycosyltransferase involved in cell wall biosynthesis
MRILFFSSHHGVGASETLWLQSAINLKSQGHEVTSIINWHRRDPKRLADLKLAGIPATYVNARAVSGRFIGKLLPRLFSHGAWEKACAKRLIRHTSPDLIVFSEGNDISALPFMELAMAMEVPFQVVTHGLNEAEWPHDNITDRMRSAFQAARRTFWVARRNIQDFEYHIGAALGNAEVVRNPCNVDRHVAFQWPRSSTPLRLACVARLQTRPKGHDLLLQALAQPQWRERPLCLTFFGDGENRRGLERLAAFLGISDRIQFAGHVDSIHQIWRDHHMIAQPSRNEGMPVSLVEALLCGRPALATDVAGHAELITDGENGFLASAATSNHIAEALERAWQHRDEWCKMGEIAYGRIRQMVPEDPAAAFAKQIIC